MEQQWIDIRGAKENNLKNISLKIPRGKMVVMTGLSGSGKTSLAFDTIYAEGQRRYVESLSAYARQFLGGVEPLRKFMIFCVCFMPAVERPIVPITIFPSPDRRLRRWSTPYGNCRMKQS